VQLTEQDIEKVALNYHNWQQADFKTTYQDIPEFCKSARFEEIEANNFSLEGISWNNDNGFNQIVLNQFSTDFIFFTATRQSTVGKDKACNAIFLQTLVTNMPIRLPATNTKT
jgi:type I restriction-modification system DNA methylase subunit